MRSYSASRSPKRSSFLGHPGEPFRPPHPLVTLIALAWALATWWTAPDAGAASDVLGAWIGIAITGIVTAFGWLADKAVTVALVVWHAIQVVGSALGHFAIGLGQVLAKVYKLFASFWSAVLRPFIGYVWRAVDHLQAWLKGTFGPALKFLEMLRQRTLDIYNKYFKPVLDTIDVARRTLQLLAVFRVQWARELDRKLAELQDAILWPIREVMLRLNQAMDWINRIVTLDGLFQRLTLLRSITRDIGRIGAIWHAAHSRPLTDEERRTDPSLPPLVTAAETISDHRLWLRTGGGRQASSIAEWSAELRQERTNA